MGLNWSDGRMIQSKAEQQFKIVFNASLISTGLIAIQEFWAIYNTNKADIKIDGFSVAKKEFGNTWQISFWYDVGSTRLTGRGIERAVMAAKAARDTACDKWKACIYRKRDQMNNRVLENVDQSELNMADVLTKTTASTEEDYSMIG
jgi:hypothetical protein